MYEFRKNTPVRDPKRNECQNYSSYKQTLKKDFNNRCGYCDDSDSLRIRNFSIDHFVPQNPISIDNLIAPNIYQNLVWACSYCNSAKSNKWPTRQAAVHNIDNVGFVDPVDISYSDFFERNRDGSISAKNNNELAKYMINELNLWLPVHSITWKIEKILLLETEIQTALEQTLDEKLKEELKVCHDEISIIGYTVFKDLLSENE
jgi:HNH endonuclease